MDCVRANEGYRVLSLLFKILDQGPTYSHQSVLKILYGLLSGIDLAEQNIRAHLPSWIAIVARFVTGQIWKDASLVLEAVLKSFPSPIQLDAGPGLRTQAVSHAPTKAGFTNKPGSGVDHTLTELMKVLATTMATPANLTKAKKSPSATYEVFEKFFSFNDVAQAGKAQQVLIFTSTLVLFLLSSCVLSSLTQILGRCRRRRRWREGGKEKRGRKGRWLNVRHVCK